MNINRIYILKTITKSAWSNFPIEVIEGRLPQMKMRLQFLRRSISNAKVDYKIGDQLTLDIGDRWHKTDGTKLTQDYSLERGRGYI